MLYERLDGLRQQAADHLAEQLRNTGGTPQARSQRDSAIAMYAEQVDRFGAVENGLCFGRLDFDNGSRRYIGRIGIFETTTGDAEPVEEPLLMDWRAPAARAFYLATAAAPDGVRRRRHIRTRDRTVVGIDDEVLDLSTARSSDHADLTGEAALLAALTAGRTGRMSDIVQTIQAEQDRVIRSALSGVLVVQGGPGTGKTAVALHRAAYLLYTHRQQLATRGVLIVGPNATFLRYISQVLPTLAETGVLLRTVGELYSGVRPTRDEPPAVAEIKGRLAMTGILAAAVRDRQEVPETVLPVEVERDTLLLDRQTCLAARERARRSGRPHNLARELFDIEVIHALAAQVAERIGADPLGGENLLDEADLAEIRRELRAEPGVEAALDQLWPRLTPRRLLSDLFSSAERITAAAPELDKSERRRLYREPGGWSPADAPLLDEAAELLGRAERRDSGRDDRIRRERIEYAEGVLDITHGSRSIDLEDEDEGEILSVADLLDADRLVERHADREQLTTAQRAAADRQWAFGHIIVDEAQELSPMAWRLLMRRCPSRSMTIVGDVAQTGALSGAGSWADVLSAYVGGRWRMEELTVSYRTPAEIMAVAAEVLAEIDPTLTPPRAVRQAGVPPWDIRVEPERLGPCLVEMTVRELAEISGAEDDEGGRVGVLVPASLAGELGRTVTAALPDAAVGEHPDLGNRVVVLTVGQAKGLEFDAVIVVDPERMVSESPRGRNDLYVALTRATRRLGVLRTGHRVDASDDR